MGAKSKKLCIFAPSYNKQLNINIMAKRKYMLCQYPSNGFGSKNGTFYLLDVFGNKYGFLDEYDKTLGEMNKIISVNGTTYCERSMDEIIERIEMETDSKIERW